MPLSLNTIYLLPMHLIADQLSTQAGRTIQPHEISSVDYDPLTLPQPIARVTLRPRRTNFTQVTEYFIFNRTQVVNFFNSVSGLNISPAAIIDIRSGSDPVSFVELVPAQT